MASEALEDNKPPLQDDNHAKSEIPEKDASSDAVAAKSENANAGDKDGGAAGNQEVEEEADAAEEKKEEIDEDGEEKDEQEEKEEEDEAEEKEKEKAKGKGKRRRSKKDPVTPAPSERPTRERKTVERFSVPSPAKSARSSASKGLIIEKVKFIYFLFNCFFLGCED